MREASTELVSWPAIVDAVSGVVDLAATARATKALVRPRKVRTAEDLLRLALMYGAGGLSLRGVAAEATVLRIAELSDVAVLNRLRNCDEWLGLILSRLLAERAGIAVEEATGLRLALVDGTTVSAPGSEGSEWRLHARYEPAAGRFTDLTLTDAKTAERLSRVTIAAGDVMVSDRGYARVRDFADVRAAGGDFLTRIGWRAVQLFDADGRRFDPLAGLPPADSDVIEHAVLIGRNAIPARLVIARIPTERAQRQQARITRKASKKGHKTDPRTRIAAGYLMLLTSLSAERCPPRRVAALYRLRWQVELAFKRLKSLGGFSGLPASDPALARTWLLAQLIVAVLSEDLVKQVLDFPPLSRSQRLRRRRRPDRSRRPCLNHRPSRTA